MPSYIVHHDGWFFQWSTVSDAPETWCMRRSQFEAWYREEYGRAGMHDLHDRLERAVRFGSSLRTETSAEDAVFPNVAGYKGSRLTLEEIVRIYGVERREPREGEGIPDEFEDEDDDETDTDDDDAD